VALGCWFQGIAVHESDSSVILCADAPVFKGVVGIGSTVPGGEVDVVAAVTGDLRVRAVRVPGGR
jgi:hypothetical protein